MARVEKRAEAEGRTIVWVDESGFSLLPAKVRTYAPRGQTPILRVPLTRDHLSAISALTPQGRVFLQVQEHSFSSEDVVAFLRQLLRHIPTQLLVIWDGAPIHRSKVIKDFLASGAARRIQLERLPGYAPELNPVDGLWGYLKYRELGNVCCDNLPRLHAEIKGAYRRFHRKRHLVRSFIRHAGYQV